MKSSSEYKTIYLMGIGGIAMGTLAGMLKDSGYEVVGSDQNLYPPMSTHLESRGIPLFQGYRAENLWVRPVDLVIVGNVIRRENPEAQAVLEHGIPHMSMPQAIARFFLGDHQSMVVAGTHGKSTTSSLLGWILAQGGMDPSVFVGAFLNNWAASYRLGKGPFMVLEGDEYDTAFFDKGPKFLHYRPKLGIITSVEFDHADIFPNLESIVEAFRAFARLIPPDGHLILNGDDPVCRRLARECGGCVVTYGRSEHADWRILDHDCDRGRASCVYFDPLRGERRKLVTSLMGRHNLGNALAAVVAATLAGVSEHDIRESLVSFRGVKRRQDWIGNVRGIRVMDDFAHHPTAVSETLLAVKECHPEARLIAAFEPRTNSSRRKVFQDDYATAFEAADVICVKVPPGIESIPESERLDAAKLVQDIARGGREAHLFESTDLLVGFLSEFCGPGDLVVCMSNGSFDGLPHRLTEALGNHAPV